MNARARKAVGCFVLLAYLAIYTLFAASVGTWLAAMLPPWGEIVYFAIAGVVWVFPLKPLFAWIRRGADSTDH